ncbi:MAG: gliding motility-associated C-terminal domain-containing protein [Flavobacteriia bacterium]
MNQESFETILKEKLNAHEVPVRPELWNNVAKSAGISSGGIGIGTVLGIASGVLLVAGTLGYFMFSPTQKKEAVDSRAVKTVVKESQVQQKEILPKNTTPTAENNKETLLFDEIESSFEIPVTETRTLEQMPINEETAEIPSLTLNTPVIEKVQMPAPKELTKAQAPSISEIKPFAQRTLPNTITPNNDGINDELMFDASGLTDFNLVVIDQAYKVIFSTTDPAFRWAGNLPNGDAVPAGNYQYYFSAKNESGQWVTQYASLTITR